MQAGQLHHPWPNLAFVGPFHAPHHVEADEDGEVVKGCSILSMFLSIIDWTHERWNGQVMRDEGCDGG